MHGSTAVVTKAMVHGYPEDGGGGFLRNVRNHLQNRRYIARSTGDTAQTPANKLINKENKYMVS